MPKDNPIPEKYRCSITSQIMIDPVIAADGHTYEREAIEEWLQTHDTSPKTNIKLKHKELTENHDKRSDILDFLDSHPELYEGDEVYLPKAWVAECVRAIKGNQLQAVQRWLDKDKRLLTLKLEDDSTALHLACEFGSPELVDSLLKNLKQKNESIQPGAIGFKSIHLNVLLERALNNSDYAQCELLLSLGAEVEQPEISTSQNTLLNQMVISENPEALSWLLDKTEISSQNTLLHRMVINDNLEAVNWLVDQKAVLESRNSEGNTPLLLSVIHNHTKLTEFLLKNNANPQVKNAEQQNPVLIALLNQNEPMLSLLVGAEKAALPSLHLALELNDNEIIKSLLNQNIGNIEALDEQQRTPFYNAIERGNLEAAILLLTQGANPAVSCGLLQLSPLHIAVERGDVEILRYLLQTQAVALIDMQNAQGDTPLHLAVQAGHDSIIPLLLEAGAYHKIKNEQDQTPIELARIQQKLKLANLIVQTVRGLKQAKLKETDRLHKVVAEQASEIANLKADLQRQEQSFASIQAKLKETNKLHQVAVAEQASEIANLKTAFQNQQQDFKKQLSDMQPPMAKLSRLLNGRTPVYIAAEDGDASAIAALHAAGANVDTPMPDGRTPVYIAAENGHASAINALHVAGANVDTPMPDGRTPVYIAAQNGHAPAIAALHAAGANVDTPQKDSYTPTYISAQHGHASAIVALKSAGANVDAPNNNGTTPIWIAAQNGHTPAIAALIAAGANVNKPKNTGATPISIAAEKGRAGAITALLEAGANVNIKDKKGVTALEKAKQGNQPGHREVIRLLEAHLEQYSNGVGPARVVDKEAVFHANPSSSAEEKNPPMLKFR